MKKSNPIAIVVGVIVFSFAIIRFFNPGLFAEKNAQSAVVSMKFNEVEANKIKERLIVERDTSGSLISDVSRQDTNSAIWYKASVGKTLETYEMPGKPPIKIAESAIKLEINRQNASARAYFEFHKDASIEASFECFKILMRVFFPNAPGEWGTLFKNEVFVLRTSAEQKDRAVTGELLKYFPSAVYFSDGHVTTIKLL